jgi:hypothetical protein
MATGWTSTGSLADSLPTVIDAARIVREFEAVMPKLVDRTTLPEGTGLNWDEISLAKLTAQTVTEQTILDNPQQIQDTLFSVSPTIVGIQTLVTDRTKRRISKNVAARMGELAGNAMERKKDADGLAILDGATTSLSGAGTTLASSIVGAAANRIMGNSTERGVPPLYTVLHPFQLKDIQDELVSGVGTYVIPAGLTQDTFRQGFSGSLYNTEVYTNGNILIDSSDDAKGGVFAKEAIVLVQGHSPRAATKREEGFGGGAEVMYMYDEYAYGERSAGNWLYEVYSDATSPNA